MKTEKKKEIMMRPTLRSSIASQGAGPQVNSKQPETI